MKKTSPKKFANEMKNTSQSGDIENNHFQADELMCRMLNELGYKEGVAIFKKMEKWYA